MKNNVSQKVLKHLREFIADMSTASGVFSVPDEVIGRQLGISRPHANRAIHALIDAGELVREKQGLYHRVTAKPAPAPVTLPAPPPSVTSYQLPLGQHDGACTEPLQLQAMERLIELMTEVRDHLYAIRTKADLGGPTLGD